MQRLICGGCTILPRKANLLLPPRGCNMLLKAEICFKKLSEVGCPIGQSPLAPWTRTFHYKPTFSHVGESDIAAGAVRNAHRIGARFNLIPDCDYSQFLDISKRCLILKYSLIFFASVGRKIFSYYGYTFFSWPAMLLYSDSSHKTFIGNITNHS